MTDLLRKEKAGKVTIENLNSGTCVELMDRLHGKVFLKMKIFVTAVVAASPVKPPENKSLHPDPLTGSTSQVNQHNPVSNSEIMDPSTTTSDSSSSTPTTCTLDQTSPLTPTPSSFSTDAISLVVDSVPSNTAKGPGVKQKIDIFDEKTERKAEKSPELSKKDKNEEC